MPEQESVVTPCAAINDLLYVVRDSLLQALGPELVGLYVHGSLALGDFDPRSSDVDLLAVTAAPLTDRQFERVAALHRDWRSRASRSGQHIEISYMSSVAVRRSDPAADRHPALNVDGVFERVTHGAAWVIQRHVVREHGLVLAGPPPPRLIDQVTAGELREAAVATLREWWVPQLADPVLLATREYQAYSVLTMCRARYTVAQGDIVSKPVAARWARQTLPVRWHHLIEVALRTRADTTVDPDGLSPVLEFVRATLLDLGVV